MQYITGKETMSDEYVGYFKDKLYTKEQRQYIGYYLDAQSEKKELAYDNNNLYYWSENRKGTSRLNTDKL